MKIRYFSKFDSSSCRENLLTASRMMNRTMSESTNFYNLAFLCVQLHDPLFESIRIFYVFLYQRLVLLEIRYKLRFRKEKY